MEGGSLFESEVMGLFSTAGHCHMCSGVIIFAVKHAILCRRSGRVHLRKATVSGVTSIPEMFMGRSLREWRKVSEDETQCRN